MVYIGALALSGGRGGRLNVITADAPKPYKRFTGKYRLIDWTLTNIARTNALHDKATSIDDVIVAVQFEADKLIEHIGSGAEWGFTADNPLSSRTISIMGPKTDIGGMVFYDGTADAARKTMPSMKKHGWSHSLILSADHVYASDYAGFIDNHFKTNADFSIMVLPVEESKVKDLGILKLDSNGRIISFTEKPQQPEIIDEYRIPD